MKLWFSLEMVDSACTSWFSIRGSLESDAREKRTHVSGLSKSPFRPSFFRREGKKPTEHPSKPQDPPSVAVSTYFAFIVSKTWQIRATSGNCVPIWTEIEIWLNDWFHDIVYMPRKSRNCLDIRRIIGI